MYDHTFNRGRKRLFRYCLQAFSAEKILQSQIKDCFKIDGKQIVIMPKKGECVKFKNYERKIKSLFTIHGDFEIILVPENNGKKFQQSLMQANFKTYCLQLWIQIGMCR